MSKIRIISRNSQLAMWQATSVKAALQNAYPELTLEISGITTAGDRILDQSLDKIGGKGLFIKELELQLLAGSADIAVHSLKDLPANLDPQFTLAAILPRENPCDALVSPSYASLDEMPVGAIIGTSSARRKALLSHYYPDLQIRMLRGNLQTRIAKLDLGEYAAIILAVAGLKRLELTKRIKQELAVDKFVPAIGQGALAIEVCARRSDLIKLLQPLNDEISAASIGAEREMGRFLNASCNIPLAGYATIQAGQLELRAVICDPDSGLFITAHAQGSPMEYLAVGQECARQLLANGAAAIVSKFGQN